MRRAISRILMVALIGSLTTLWGCSKSESSSVGQDVEGAAEKAGKEVDKAAGAAATQAEKAANDVESAAKDAMGK